MLAIVRRGLKGLPIFRPDKRHIHHKLLGIGYSTRVVVANIVSIITVVSQFFGVVVFWSHGRWAPVLSRNCLSRIHRGGAPVQFQPGMVCRGRTWETRLEMEESIRYALALARWFEMEAKNCNSVENLWSDFQLVLAKLSFARANLCGRVTEFEWARNRRAGPVRILCLEPT